MPAAYAARVQWSAADLSNKDSMSKTTETESAGSLLHAAASATFQSGGCTTLLSRTPKNLVICAPALALYSS